MPYSIDSDKCPFCDTSIGADQIVCHKCGKGVLVLDFGAENAHLFADFRPAFGEICGWFPPEPPDTKPQWRCYKAPPQKVADAFQ